MLTATLSNSKFDIIQLQRGKSAAKSNASSRCFYFVIAEGIDTAITYRYSLQSVFLKSACD